MKSILSIIVLIFTIEGMALQVDRGHGKVMSQTVNKNTIKFIIADEDGPSGCTGTFISESTILTAAHCLPRRLNGDEKLLLFKNSEDLHDLTINEEFESYGIEDFDYIQNETFQYLKNAGGPTNHIVAPTVDIGLIRFKKPLFDGTPMNLMEVDSRASVESQISADDNVFFVGAGARNFPIWEKDRKIQDFIYGLTTGIRGTAVEIIQMGPVLTALSRRGVKICDGDSGGPLIVQGADTQIHQIGVISQIHRNRWQRMIPSTTSCSRQGRFAPLTRSNLNWIENNLVYTDFGAL